MANVVSILPSLPCDPTIAKDPRRTPAKASLQEVSDLQICEQITSLTRHLLPLRMFMSRISHNGQTFVNKKTSSSAICYARPAFDLQTVVVGSCKFANKS
jgi:hypothetical protein